MTTSKKTGTSILKNVLVIIFLFLTFSLVQAQSADDNFSGNWKTEQGPVIKITDSSGIFKGVSVEYDKLVLDDLKFEDDEWTGTLIQPKDGSKYKCTAVLNGDKIIFKVKKGIMSRTINWTREQ